MANGAILGQTAPTPTAQEVTVQQSTAQQFGFSGASNVDAVLQILKNAAVVNSAGDALETVLGSTLLSIPGVKIATGSYAGTGTYGSENPNSITAPFPIKILTILGRIEPNGDPSPIFGSYSSVSTGDRVQTVMVSDLLTTDYKSEVGFVLNDRSRDCYGKKSTDGKTFYWYASGSVVNQYNDLSNTFYWLAIG